MTDESKALENGRMASEFSHLDGLTSPSAGPDRSFWGIIEASFDGWLVLAIGTLITIAVFYKLRGKLIFRQLSQSFKTTNPTTWETNFKAALIIATILGCVSGFFWHWVIVEGSPNSLQYISEIWNGSLDAGFNDWRIILYGVFGAMIGAALIFLKRLTR